MLGKLGIEQRPAWLLKAAGTTKVQRRPSVDAATVRETKRDFWMVGPTGNLMLPDNDEIDVEAETRKRLQRAGNYAGEESLSEQVYDWWRGGGWFGTADQSGEYEARDMDDDVTSMVSMSTNASTTSDDGNESGRRTPTQHDPYGDREDTPAVDGSLDMTVLSRLLNPQSAAEREEARILSYSLTSSRPVTRSQYRRNQDRSRAKLLNGLRGSTQPSSENQDEEDLEQFILAQRSKTQSKAAKTGSTWDTGAAGLGASGPQCVVCQSTPRSVLVWPCGCLSMCDECRVGLAARNYTKCICCRTDIAAYSRLYVP